MMNPSDVAITVESHVAEEATAGDLNVVCRQHLKLRHVFQQIRSLWLSVILGTFCKLHFVALPSVQLCISSRFRVISPETSRP